MKKIEVSVYASNLGESQEAEKIMLDKKEVKKEHNIKKLLKLKQ